jgi:uroporphyrinogen-III synthase
LPFVPLVGMGGDQYSRWRAGEEDVRKRGLLFLVGEQRRDVIPRVLGVGGGEVERSINVEEVEVYSTVIREGFEGEFTRKVDELEREGEERVVIVVFSPGGCEAMLRGIGWGVEDGDDQTGENATQPKRKIDRSRFVVAAIGPTTRDYLKEKFGFEVDVTVKIPSPEGLAEGVDTFLRGIGLLAQGSGR